MKPYYLVALWVACMPVLLIGCAHAAKNTTGFALSDEATVDAPLDQTWQATKAVLREMELDIYTRDTRGEFVVYDKMKRKAFLAPHRTECTITLTEASSSSTKVTISTVRQVYGVTLLTYPDWHDRKAVNNTMATAILDGLKKKLSAA